MLAIPGQWMNGLFVLATFHDFRIMNTMSQVEEYMTYYHQELDRIRGICFSNKFQVEVAINTRKYINENFQQPINLDLLAGENAISKFYLIRVFRKYLGVTPGQYLINRRMAEARKLLREGRSVTDTCFLVGYESVGSFSNQFTAKTGVTPTLFQSGNFR